MGIIDIETRYEATIEKSTARASAVKRYLLTPNRKSTGRKPRSY
jgi:hypothetical protein